MRSAGSERFSAVKGIAALVLAVVAADPSGAGEPPLTLMRSIPLAEVQGRIDHLAVDPDRQRLYVAERGNSTLGVVDLAEGKRIGEIGGLSEPQGVVYLQNADLVVVTNGGTGDVRAYRGETLELAGTVKLSGDADNIRYDPRADLVYVGYGNGNLGILEFGAAGGRHVGDIPLRGHPESFQLNGSGTRAFVNVAAAAEVAVVDLESRTVVARWPLDAGANFPMALDEDHHRLFVGARRPAALIVLDTETGTKTARVEVCGDADDLFHDARRSRLYVACGSGSIDVISTAKADAYARVAQIPTAPGARTALLLPGEDRIYLAVPERATSSAEIRIYSTVPSD